MTELVHYTKILALLSALQSTLDVKFVTLDARLDHLEQSLNFRRPLVPEPTESGDPAPAPSVPGSDAPFTNGGEKIPTLENTPLILERRPGDTTFRIVQRVDDKMDTVSQEVSTTMEGVRKLGRDLRVVEGLADRTDKWTRSMSARMDRHEEKLDRLATLVQFTAEQTRAEIAMRDERFDTLDTAVAMAIGAVVQKGDENLAATEELKAVVISAAEAETGHYNAIDQKTTAIQESVRAANAGIAGVQSAVNGVSGKVDAVSAKVEGNASKLLTVEKAIRDAASVTRSVESTVVAKTDEIIKLEHAAKLRDECIYQNTITREINEKRRHDRDDFYPLVDIHTGQQIDCVTRDEISNAEPAHKKRYLRQLGMQEPFPNVARYYWAYLKSAIPPSEGTQ